MFNNLPPGVYHIKYIQNQNEFSPIYLCDQFTLPAKIYGSTIKKATRVWNDFAVSEGSSGVLLTGIQGTGKSSTSEYLCNIGLKFGMPTIYVTGGSGVTQKNIASLIHYLTTLNNCVVYIDEFYKILGYGSQDMLLTLFSSNVNNRKLFVLTENNENNISPFLRNRPGRIKYHYDYKKVEKEVVKEYCIDHNVKPDFIQDLIKKWSTAGSFSFDHLQAIIGEHLHYPDESLNDILNVLNVKILREPELYVLKEIINKSTSASVNFPKGGSSIDATKIPNRVSITSADPEITKQIKDVTGHNNFVFYTDSDYLNTNLTEDELVFDFPITKVVYVRKRPDDGLEVTTDDSPMSMVYFDNE